MSSFGSRLDHVMREQGPLCVGIDPHPSLLESWGLPDTPQGLSQFAATVLQALVGQVAAIKPQIAFFERHGSAGLAVLEEIIGTCRENNQVCVIDAKRGDIGSTMAGYAEAYLRPGAPFAADAVTLSPYLGIDSLSDTAEYAQEHDRGLFILALTSNPEGFQVQHAQDSGGLAVAARICQTVAKWNNARGKSPELGDIGLVIGATVGTAISQLGMDLHEMGGPILVPGIGAQGATVSDLPSTFGQAMQQILVNSSRDILSQGPDIEQIRRVAAQLATKLSTIR